MASAFKEKERKEITQKMKHFAIKRALEVGMKKTSVDSIVEYANISKGAFYKFYRSKDELFLEIVEDWHTEIYSVALKYLNSGLESSCERASEAIFEACKVLYNNGVMKFYLNDLSMLLENISNTPLAKNYHDDSVHIDEVIGYSGTELRISKSTVSDIVKNIAYTVLNADNLGDGYWVALKIIIYSICREIII